MFLLKTKNFLKTLKLNTMKLTYLGHASLALEIKGINIIVDPFISGNELAEHINIDELKADYILITHGHDDHVADVERIAKIQELQLFQILKL